MSRAAHLPRPRAIFFDMDGTLTKPLLDFDAIRRDLGVSGPILEAIRHLRDEELRRAQEILDRHERAAAEQSELNAGCLAMLDWLASNQYRTALITRNSLSSTRMILSKHSLKFDVVFTREDEPAKPHPDALHRAMRSFGLEDHEVWMVGDGSHDIEAAEAAGVTSVWISHRSPRTFAAKPSVIVESLDELLPMLRAVHSPKSAERV